MCRKNKKGYTLAELLIVVAIIGILVAISIPIFGKQLRKAKVAVDQANARAAKGAMVAYILTYADQYVDGNNHYFYYDASTGEVIEGITNTKRNSIEPYGKTSDATAADNIEGVNGNMNLTKLIVYGKFMCSGTDIVTDDGSKTEAQIIGDQIEMGWTSPDVKLDTTDKTVKSTDPIEFKD